MFWRIYVFLINRIHRQPERCVKMNDVDGYIAVFSAILDVSFSLNRPNYARWGILFLQRLKSFNTHLLKLLEEGVFSVCPTKKNYSRSVVDILLEQAEAGTEHRTFAGLEVKVQQFNIVHP